MTLPVSPWPALEEAASRGDIFPFAAAVVREHAERLQADARVAVVPCPVVRLDERKETRK